jgi:ParB family transcriptional regulator, chromosome partitioning protein
MNVARLEVDLHLLDLRFAAARLVEPQVVERLARSIERDGQIVPCIVVGNSSSGSCAANGERLVLVDGYRRVTALRRLGRDTASVECWPCDLAEAVPGVLARTQSRPFAAIEEALLLRELTQGLGLSQQEAARRCGRDVSWVSRRLQLLSTLPDAALVAVIEGRLSSWAASRVVAPLARANGEHADRLVKSLSAAPLSGRALRSWFEHYQKSRRAVRERMVDHPHLFLKALNESAEQTSSERLRDGPEGRCEIALRRINVLIRSVHKQLPDLCPLSADLMAAVSLVQTNFEALGQDIKRYAEDDADGDPQQRECSQGPRSQPA